MRCSATVRVCSLILWTGAALLTIGCQAPSARPAGGGVDDAPVQPAARTTRTASTPATPMGATPMTAEEQDAMAAELLMFYVEVAPWEYTLGYVDEDTLHVWSVVRLREDTPMPFTGVMSGLPQIVPEEEGFATITSITPPVRHINRPDGLAEPGYFEPRTGAFFRWRGVTRPQDPAVPVVDPEKVAVVVDIDPPP